MSKLSNSWELMKASATVLRSDKQLIVFPTISGIASLLVTAAFFIPVVAYYIAHPTPGHNPPDVETPAYYAGLFVFYLIQYFIVFYMNTALVGAALIRLRGGRPTVHDGLQIARSRIGVIFGYALFASTVGMILRAISERLGIVGRIVIGLLGAAWNIATFLVVPILITEKVSSVGAVKRSAEMLKETWGENLIGNAGIGTACTLIALLIMIPFGVLIGMAIAAGSIGAVIALLVLLVVAFLAVALLQSALGGVYTAAVYLYAVEGVPPSEFTAEQIHGAFTSKKRRK